MQPVKEGRQKKVEHGWEEEEDKGGDDKSSTISVVARLASTHGIGFIKFSHNFSGFHETSSQCVISVMSCP